MAVATFQILPAFATINNTVTASGTGPGNVAVTGTAPATVGVQLHNEKITVVKTATLVDIAGGSNVAGKGDVGETINYTYVVKNTGNVTVTAVGVTDAHDGTGPDPAPSNPILTTNVAPAPGSSDANTTDNKWDILRPLDAVTFTASYVITAGDINANGGGTTPDGKLHNTATASAIYTNPQGTPTVTPVTATDTKFVELNVTPGLTITKVADLTTNVAAGTPVTYTYTVTNTGNTQITGITLTDIHNASLPNPVPIFQSFTTNLGGSTNSGNTITKLMPGDVAQYKATYTVTQSDVDNLQ